MAKSAAKLTIPNLTLFIRQGGLICARLYMTRFLRYLAILACLSPLGARAQFEQFRDSVVQLYGVVMTADSLRGLPDVSVVVKGTGRGTLTNYQGVFSIVVMKGDVVEFTFVGFKPLQITVPRTIEGNQYNIVQLMVTDTVYLPATIIKPRPTREQFERDFVSSPVPDDDIEVARQNNDVAKRRVLSSAMPSDGREATNLNLSSTARRTYYSGQVPPMNIMNPVAWGEFVRAWKRGDFKKK
jgi:hypothetical protein